MLVAKASNGRILSKCKIIVTKNTKEQEQLNKIIENEKKNGRNPIDNDEVVKLLRKEFSALSDDAFNEIKKILHDAEEPFKSLFLHTVLNTNFSIKKDINVSNYWGKTNTVTMKTSQLTSKIHEKNGILFHEYGHAIDSLCPDKQGYNSVNNGELKEKIREDIEDTIRKTINAIVVKYKYRLSSKNIHNIVSNIMGYSNMPELDDKLKYFRDKTVEDINKRLKNGGPPYNAISDVYGGMTNNVLLGEIGHEKDYWYDRNGNDFNCQPSELWAEYYSCCIRNSPGKGAIRDYFPKSTKIMDQMALDMLAQLG